MSISVRRALLLPDVHLQLLPPALHTIMRSAAEKTHTQGESVRFIIASLRSCDIFAGA